MRYAMFLLLLSCAAPNRENYAQKYGERSQMLENQEPPMSQQQLERNTAPPGEPEATPARP